MRAAVIHEAGGPGVLKFENRLIPTPINEQVLFCVNLFGLKRSGLPTRQGYSPGVLFPRISGIEAVGVVNGVPSNESLKGDIVAIAMGGLGRQYYHEI